MMRHINLYYHCNSKSRTSKGNRILHSQRTFISTHLQGIFLVAFYIFGVHIIFPLLFSMKNYWFNSIRPILSRAIRLLFIVSARITQLYIQQGIILISISRSLIYCVSINGLMCLSSYGCALIGLKTSGPSLSYLSICERPPEFSYATPIASLPPLSTGVQSWSELTVAGSVCGVWVCVSGCFGCLSE